MEAEYFSVAKPEQGQETVGDPACAECGYNLHGLSVTSVCPERGTSIQHSLSAGPLIAWKHSLRVGAGALTIAMVFQCMYSSGLLLDYGLQRIVMRLHINFEGSIMVLQAAALLVPTIWLTRRGPPGRKDASRRRGFAIVGVAVLFVLGVINLLAWNSQWRISASLLLSGYALGPIVVTVSLFWIFGAVADVAVEIPHSLPKLVIQSMRWLMGYSMLSPALGGAIINFARISYIGSSLPIGKYWVNAGLSHWMQKWLFLPGQLIFLPVWLAAIFVVVHTFFQLRPKVGRWEN